MRTGNEIFSANIESTINHETFKVLGECINTGAAPRGLPVAECLLTELQFHPYFCIQHFAERPFNWKYFAGELYWYLLKDRKLDVIGEFSKFWNKLTDSEGNVNSNYGSLLFGDQIQWVVQKLRKDLYTRQAVALVNRPEFQYEGNKDFPCTMYLNFFVRDNFYGETPTPTLFMKVTMRSNDIFYGLCYDAPFFSALMQTVYLNLGGNVINFRPDDTPLALGSYIHYADNIHFYTDQFGEIAQSIIESTEDVPCYALLLREPLLKIEENGDITLPGNTLEFMKAMDEIGGSGKQADYQEILKILFKIDRELYTKIVQAYNEADET